MHLTGTPGIEARFYSCVILYKKKCGGLEFQLPAVLHFCSRFDCEFVQRLNEFLVSVGERQAHPSLVQLHGMQRLLQHRLQHDRLCGTVVLSRSSSYCSTCAATSCSGSPVYHISYCENGFILGDRGWAFDRRPGAGGAVVHIVHTAPWRTGAKGQLFALHTAAGIVVGLFPRHKADFPEPFVRKGIGRRLITGECHRNGEWG